MDQQNDTPYTLRSFLWDNGTQGEVKIYYAPRKPEWRDVEALLDEPVVSRGGILYAARS